jgi:hypothetical protein
MRAMLALGVIGLGLLNVGCTMVGSAADHVVYAAKETIEDHLERARYRQWATAAWGKIAPTAPAVPSSGDYADGFQEGFVDYLDAGGTGEPPPLPPRRYQALRYQTAQGYEAIDAWFAGYRHGVAVARQGPYRDWITGPSSLRVPSATISQITAEASGHPAGPPAVAPGGAAEELPLPRKESAAPGKVRASPPPDQADRASNPPLYYGTGWRSLRTVSDDKVTKP